MLILWLLAIAVIPKIQSAQSRARDSKRRTDIQTIATALELYHTDNNAFPISTWLYLHSTVNVDTWRLPWLVPHYMSSIPVDPINNYPYGNYQTSVVWYKIPNDPAYASPYAYVYHDSNFPYATNPAARGYIIDKRWRNTYQLYATFEVNNNDPWSCGKRWYYVIFRYNNGTKTNWNMCPTGSQNKDIFFSQHYNYVESVNP